ncbi:MAG: hypothetical protein ACI9SP_000767 [Arenicella sp.]|jgi:hypothetical protein
MSYGAFKTKVFDLQTRMTPPYLVDSIENRKRLIKCDFIKDKILKNGFNENLLEESLVVRKNVLLKK